LKLRDAFFTDDHIHVICSEPTKNGSVVVFNFTSREFGKDTTSVVGPDEYPLLSNESVIAYKYGALFSSKRMARLELLGAQRQPPISDDLLLRIQKGAVASPDTEPQLKSIIQAMLRASKP
jgi:hypothetical protein